MVEPGLSRCPVGVVRIRSLARRPKFSQTKLVHVSSVDRDTTLNQRVNEILAAVSGSALADVVANARVSDMEVRLCRALLQSGQLEAAEEWLARANTRGSATELQASAELWLQLGRAWQRVGKTDRAEPALRQALAGGSRAAAGV